MMTGLFAQFDGLESVGRALLVGQLFADVMRGVDVLEDELALQTVRAGNRFHLLVADCCPVDRTAIVMMMTMTRGVHFASLVRYVCVVVLMMIMTSVIVAHMIMISVVMAYVIVACVIVACVIMIMIRVIVGCMGMIGILLVVLVVGVVMVWRTADEEGEQKQTDQKDENLHLRFFFCSVCVERKGFY